MSVADTAKSVARTAIDEARRVDRERAQAEADERQAKRDAQQAAAADTCRRSPLRQWFPDVEWSVMDFAYRGISTSAAQDGRGVVVADPKREVYLLIQPGQPSKASADACHQTCPLRRSDCREGCKKDRIVVYLTDRNPKTDTNSQASYYDGVEVTSVEDLGRALLAREQAARRRLVRA